MTEKETQGVLQTGGGDWDDPPKAWKSNFIHHDFVEFLKQRSRCKAILSSIFTAVLWS